MTNSPLLVNWRVDLGGCSSLRLWFLSVNELGRGCHGGLQTNDLSDYNWHKIGEQIVNFYYLCFVLLAILKKVSLFLSQLSVSRNPCIFDRKITI